MTSDSTNIVKLFNFFDLEDFDFHGEFENISPCSPEELFLASAKRIRRLSSFETIFREWPSANKFCLALSEYLTDIVPFGLDAKTDQPLLDVCLTNAVTEWFDCALLKRSQHLFYAHFVRGLLRELPRALDWAIVVKNGATVSFWDPISDSLYSLWNESTYRPISRLRDRPWDDSPKHITPVEYRRMFLYRYVSSQDIGAFRGDIDFVISNESSVETYVS